jgi:deoxyadenosine/deoxycytidine kinase
MWLSKVILEKTTLVTKIAEDFNAKTVLERFADNPFA